MGALPSLSLSAMCKCVCVCVYVSVCYILSVCVHVCVHVCVVYVYICVYMCVCVFIVYTYVYVCMCLCVLQLHDPNLITEDQELCSQSATQADSKTRHSRQFGDPDQFVQCRPDSDSDPDLCHFM